jgi:threonylcarbamoyladenosine tRNA methylthiotransferase MtaB
MRRRYSGEQFRAAANLIRRDIPDVAVTTDVIAGFPGESAEDFEATMRLCDELQFADMHCFPYSKRPHTGAALIEGHLSPQIRRSRLERLLELAESASRDFRARFSGRTMDVLWEEQKDGLWEGLTGNYIRIYADSEDDLQNRILPARLGPLHAGGVRGTVIQQVAA